LVLALGLLFFELVHFFDYPAVPINIGFLLFVLKFSVDRQRLFNLFFLFGFVFEELLMIEQAIFKHLTLLHQVLYLFVHYLLLNYLYIYQILDILGIFCIIFFESLTSLALWWNLTLKQNLAWAWYL